MPGFLALAVPESPGLRRISFFPQKPLSQRESGFCGPTPFSSLGHESLDSAFSREERRPVCTMGFQSRPGLITAATSSQETGSTNSGNSTTDFHSGRIRSPSSFSVTAAIPIRERILNAPEIRGRDQSGELTAERTDQQTGCSGHSGQHYRQGKEQQHQYIPGGKRLLGRRASTPGRRRAGAGARTGESRSSSESAGAGNTEGNRLLIVNTAPSTGTMRLPAQICCMENSVSSLSVQVFQPDASSSSRRKAKPVPPTRQEFPILARARLKNRDMYRQ